MPAQGDKFGEMGGDEFKIDEKCIFSEISEKRRYSSVDGP